MNINWMKRRNYANMYLNTDIEHMKEIKCTRILWRKSCSKILGRYRKLNKSVIRQAHHQGRKNEGKYQEQNTLVLVLVCTTHFLMELIIVSCSGKRAAAQNFFYICGQGCICLVFWFWRHLVPKLDFLPLERAGWLCFTGKGHAEINPKTIRHSLCGHHFC